ncbi:glycosyltransferase family 2 protein [Pseudoxanthomonas daejeonensis]|uniref:glycosyltransferase family 2 protein n=1 Tax=Pseudoxanthomonas daejeonensis TaxID=266062 RepID=UPI001F545F69|nr:glycosyltransferase family 2 protein [Pseudoxanthomonas daejeonensis]UNK56453.1 glycosyltransferase family 2 protein [Pseudoxanthomonas daejeonensis]
MHNQSPPDHHTIRISVVSPVYGCGGCLEELVDSIATHVGGLGEAFELILVDDASPDQAWQRIQELAATRPWLRGLRLARNFGQHSAISAGIEHARGEWVVVMDCDLQDPPAAIPDLYRKARGEDYDVVFAQRRNRKDSWSKRLSSWGFFRLLSWLTGNTQDSSTANFGVFHRRVVDAVCRMPERDRSFPLMVKWAGFRHGYLQVEHSERAEGRSSYTLRKLLRLATGITLSYSEKPLKLVAMLGIGCSLLAFVMVALAIARWFEGDIAVAGYTSMIASVWLVGGMLLFSMGVVGLYVGQVFRNVQGRPYYIVAEDTRP